MNSWMGRGSSCRLTDAVKDDNKDSCIYSCNCPSTCKEIQILKRPRNVQSSNWTLCKIEQKYRVSGGCEVIPRNRSGVYQVNLTPDSDIAHYADVYCDMETDGGGWTVLVRRQDGFVNFTREWDDYKNGFGSLNGEFWAGNELMHLLTTNGRTFLLRFDLEAYDGDYIYAVYENFSIGPEADNYRLRYSEYWTNSTAGDSLEMHNGMMFSTMSRDNDAASSSNCASLHKAPWWHKACFTCLLTTLYGPYPDVPLLQGIVWFYSWGDTKFAKYATMMVRPI